MTAKLLACILWAFLNVISPDDHPLSNICLSSEMVNLGNTTGEYTYARFDLINSSDESIVVQNIRVPCDCLSFNYDDTPIKPGEKRAFILSYTSHGSANPINYNAYITTTSVNNDNYSKVLKLKVIANQDDGQLQKKYSKIVFSPDVVIFKKKNSETRKSYFEIENRGDKSVIIQDILRPCDCISIYYDKKDREIRPGGNKKVTLVYSGPIDGPSRSFKLFIRISNRAMPLILDLIVE